MHLYHSRNSARRENAKVTSLYDQSDERAHVIRRALFAKPPRRISVGLRQSASVRGVARQETESLLDLEFSDYGRDPRFLPGWWVPASLLVLPFLIWIANSLR
jgi:hypothetical protein